MLDYFPILSLSFWKHKSRSWTQRKLQMRFNQCKESTQITSFDLEIYTPSSIAYFVSFQKN